ncbi:MAG: hypothetical protein IT470_00630, partial [Pseudomonadales bacterium]|nr:hypothetical protein [Pseudomonadales bacterium]
PVVKPEFCSPDIVAMSFEGGHSVNSIEVRSLSQHRRNELGSAMLELLLREILLWGEMQTDPHAGNYLIRINKNTKDAIVLLDFGSVRLIDPQLLRPLQKMLLAAYHEDQVRLCDGLIEAGFIAADAPTEIKKVFSDVLMGLIEPLNYKRKRQFQKSIPQDAVDEQGNYCWQAARLPTRMGKQALRSAFSEHFEFPGADFMLIARKLAGVYSFIAALDARIDGGIVMDKIIAEMRR